LRRSFCGKRRMTCWYSSLRSASPSTARPRQHQPRWAQLVRSKAKTWRGRAATNSISPVQARSYRVGASSCTETNGAEGMTVSTRIVTRRCLLAASARMPPRSSCMNERQLHVSLQHAGMIARRSSSNLLRCCANECDCTASKSSHSIASSREDAELAPKHCA
jgi:hypothetical protein